MARRRRRSNYDKYNEPLWDTKECKAEIDEIRAQIKAIRSLPVEAKADQAGQASFRGRYKELQDDLELWANRYKKAAAWEAYKDGNTASAYNGPKTCME